MNNIHDIFLHEVGRVSDSGFGRMNLQYTAVKKHTSRARTNLTLTLTLTLTEWRNRVDPQQMGRNTDWMDMMLTSRQ